MDKVELANGLPPKKFIGATRKIHEGPMFRVKTSIYLA